MWWYDKTCPGETGWSKVWESTDPLSGAWCSEAIDERLSWEGRGRCWPSREDIVWEEEGCDSLVPSDPPPMRHCTHARQPPVQTPVVVLYKVVFLGRCLIHRRNKYCQVLKLHQLLTPCVWYLPNIRRYFMWLWYNLSKGNLSSSWNLYSYISVLECLFSKWRECCDKVAFIQLAIINGGLVHTGSINVVSIKGVFNCVLACIFHVTHSLSTTYR